MGDPDSFDPSRDGSPLQNFRALIAWLGLSERQAATELGVSQPTLQAVKNGSRVPEYEMSLRIEIMSRRWGKCFIPHDSWPKPLDTPMRRATAPAPVPVPVEQISEDSPERRAANARAKLLGVSVCQVCLAMTEYKQDTFCPVCR